MKRKALASAGAVLFLTLTACGSSTAKTSTSATPSTTSATTAPTSAATAAPTSAATTAPTGSAAPTTAKAGSSAAAQLAAAKAAKMHTAVPTLGHKAGDFSHGNGFGEVRPAGVFNGGDPTGLVTKIVWHNWGAPKAVGTGISTYVGPKQVVAQGTQQSATIVAFNLGTCNGKLMYRAVEWYFPQHGGHFNPNTYENICTGSYAGQS